MSEIRFGYQTTAIGGDGRTFREIYEGILADCDLVASLGFDSAWFIEHHFTDYYPIPSPVVLMSHVAARLPDLSLGTCVLVTPWYQPLRLAEDVAMLSTLTNGHLHIGLGRGTAKLEYDAYDVPMAESRDRFREALDVLRLGLGGKPFTYHGQHTSVPREISLRPTPRPGSVSLYGAIGSPQSAGIMGELGLPPLCVSNFPLDLHESVLDTWGDSVSRSGHSPASVRPIAVGSILADTDEEAMDVARELVPPFFELQARHYEADMDPWKDIPGYQQFSRFFSNLKKLSSPANIDPWADLQLFGSADTVARRLERYIDLGFNYFVIGAGSPMMPTADRRRHLERFAAEVMPRFVGRRSLPRSASVSA